MKNLIERYLQNYSSINITIAGQSCSGKTTLANEIKEMFSDQYSVTIVAQDDYFKDVWDIPRSKTGYALLDSIQAFHVDEFKSDVVTLLKSGFVRMPRYNISENIRMSKDKIVKLGKINIFEGLHVISILDDMDSAVKIFMNTNSALCFKRRIERDTLKHGIAEETIRDFWKNSIEPMSELYVFPQMEFADIVMYGE